MGVLNCQKCYNTENKNNDEIITGNNILKNQKVLFALDSYKTSVSPISNNDNLSQNKFNNFINNIDKNKKFQFKKDSSTEEEFIEYNTIEIPYDDIDSEEEIKMSDNFDINHDFLEDYNTKYQKVKELIECEEDSSYRNNSMSIHENNLENIDNENIKINEEIKNKELNKNKSDLNDFINKKIRENRKNKLKTEENSSNININQNLNNDNKIYNQNNYNNLIIGDNCFHMNYQYNLNNNYNNEVGYNFGSSNYINQKIDEENEEYDEQEKKIIDISFINYKYKSSTFSQCELKNIEKSTIFDNKNSIKSEEIKTRKGTKNEASNENVNYNFSNNYKPHDDKSAISYEIEYIDENNMDNDIYNDNNIIIENEKKIGNNEIKIKKIRFIENIEQKVENEIDKIKENHNQYIITDAFCDYEPEI